MTTYIRNVILFSSLMCLYFGGNYGVNYCIMQGSSPDVSTPVLIAGASDVNTSLDPKLFENARNIADLGEPYFVTYWKLKNLLGNSRVDTLILGFTYIHFTEKQDRVLGKKMPLWAMNWFRKTYPIEEFSQLENIDINYLDFYQLKFKSMCMYPKLKHHHYLGGFIAHDVQKSNTSNYTQLINDNFYDGVRQLGISATGKTYLESIIDLCRSKGIFLVMVSAPLHQNFLRELPQAQIAYFELTKKELLAQGIPILDFSHLPFAEKEFYDAGHLNALGAKRFTKKVKQALKKL